KRTLLDTDDSGDPMGLQMTIHRPKGISIRLSVDPAGRSIYRAWEAVQIWKALADGAALELRHAESNQVILASGEIEDIEPPASEIVELLDNLVFVQARLGQVLVLPRAFARDLLDNASYARSALESGILTLPFD